MAQGRPVEAEDRARVTRLHAEGRGRNEIARETGVSSAAVSKIIAELGLSFDRKATKAATAARVTDLKARRAGIIDRLYSRAEKVLDRLEAETYVYTVVVPGSGPETVTDANPPAVDERNLSASIQTYLLSASKLEDRDASGADSLARSMLSDLGEMLGIIPAS